MDRRGWRAPPIEGIPGVRRGRRRPSGAAGRPQPCRRTDDSRHEAIDDDDLFAVARSGLEFNDPMGPARAAKLAALVRADGGRVLDLGCGQGSLLLAVAEDSPGATGDGVDLDARELARGRAAAAARGLDGRVTFHESDASTWPPGDHDVAM